jgi:hypothetical protein
VRPQECARLGIGAGGNVAQEIHADQSNPRMWDVASSKILYIHIVNSKDFTAITGLAPPESPISFKTYADLRLPFDREWDLGDVNESGISSDGAFDDIVSLEGDSEEPTTDYEHSTMSQVVTGSPLVILEPDQTVPWFKA